MAMVSLLTGIAHFSALQRHEHVRESIGECSIGTGAAGPRRSRITGLRDWFFSSPTVAELVSMPLLGMA
jgi:hypothetical protein